jgi:hypothetical protein
MSVNHRLSAREHLAEAAALHGENRLGEAVRRLGLAAAAAVAALDEHAAEAPRGERPSLTAFDERDGPGRAQRRLGAAGPGAVEDASVDAPDLLPPHAAARLASAGIAPARVRVLIRRVRADVALQDRGEETEFGSRRVEHMIAAVQQLADVASGVPTAVLMGVGAPPARLAPDLAVTDLPPLPPVPQRPGRWLSEARRRRRRSRAVTVLVPLVTVAAVIGVGVVIAIARPARPPGHRFDVLSRTHELAPGSGLSRQAAGGVPRPMITIAPRESGSP